MGRDYTGRHLTTSCRRLELSVLKKNKSIVKGRIIQSIQTWTDGSKIKLTAYYTEQDKYLQLEYNTSDGLEVSYKVHLLERPSNLGKGKVLYLVCPCSGRLSRKLYMAYDSPRFKSIKAYNNRIYYRGQLASKKHKYNQKYWSLLNHLESKPVKRHQTHYKGIPTKRYLREVELENKLEYFDDMRILQLFQEPFFI